MAVQERAERTVKWAVDHIKRSYFSRDPDHILDIWLFKEKASYERYTKEIFDDTPTTPFGYFSAAHGALIMNIATGGGTLVHEIVHPYMAANFPKCPSWFNEGFASPTSTPARSRADLRLSEFRGSRLAKAIKAHRVPAFEVTLLRHDDRPSFGFGEDPGTNYSQARYLCYYLPGASLKILSLPKHAAGDPEGYKTLQDVLGVTDMPAFQKQWEEYVMTLKAE